MVGYPYMKLLKKEPHRFGWVDIDQWYWKYPDGRELPFRTDTWNGISHTLRLGIDRETKDPIQSLATKKSE